MEESRQYNIRLSDVIYKRLLLIPKGQRSKFIVDALESGLSYQDQSVARLQREIEDGEKEVQIKRELLAKKIDTLNKQERTEKDIRARYEEFVGYLDNPDDNYNTKRTNQKYGTNLRNFKQFQQLQKNHKGGKFSIEDFKELTGD